jgi:hypothetical protein
MTAILAYKLLLCCKMKSLRTGYYKREDLDLMMSGGPSRIVEAAKR